MHVGVRDISERLEDAPAIGGFRKLFRILLFNEESERARVVFAHGTIHFVERIPTESLL